VVDVLVVNRFVVPSDQPDGSDAPDQGFLERACAAIRAFASCPGFVRARLGRAADDPRHWCLVTEWRSVGAYRRALSSYQVKLDATPLLAEAEPEPGAYEVLAACDGGEIIMTASDRASED
jgi:quinol monooxygenase YgiN